MSNARKNKKRAHLAKQQKNLVECSNCGTAKLPHTLCSSCGQYNGKVVVAMEDSEA